MKRLLIVKKISQYAPFILWGIGTLILVVIGFIILPGLLLYERVFEYKK